MQKRFERHPAPPILVAANVGADFGSVLSGRNFFRPKSNDLGFTEPFIHSADRKLAWVRDGKSSIGQLEDKGEMGRSWWVGASAQHYVSEGFARRGTADQQVSEKSHLVYFLTIGEKGKSSLAWIETRRKGGEVFVAINHFYVMNDAHSSREKNTPYLTRKFPQKTQGPSPVPNRSKKFTRLILHPYTHTLLRPPNANSLNRSK